MFIGEEVHKLYLEDVCLPVMRVVFSFNSVHIQGHIAINRPSVGIVVENFRLVKSDLRTDLLMENYRRHEVFVFKESKGVR